MRREEDPTKLNALQWVRRALNLPFAEILLRVSNLAKSLPRALNRIRRSERYAAAKGKKLHLIILTDRLGDILAAEPALARLKQPDDYIIWLPRERFRFLLQFNQNVDEVLSVSSYTETIILRWFFPRLHWTNLQMDGALCNIFGIRVNNTVPSRINVNNYYDYGSLCDVYALIGTGEGAQRCPVLYPDPTFNAQAFINSIFVHGERPLFIFHPVSDEEARSWTAEKSQVLATWILKNTEYNILEVGLTPHLFRSDRIYPLKSEIPLSQQIKLFNHASRFLGVDSGFAHVANAAGVHSILLIGKYRHFSSHLPWRLKAEDVVLRADGHVHEMSVERVCEALSSEQVR